MPGVTKITPEVARFIIEAHRHGYDGVHIKHRLMEYMGVDISYGHLCNRVLPMLRLCRKGRNVSPLPQLIAAYQELQQSDDFSTMSKAQVTAHMRLYQHVNLSRRHAMILNQLMQPDAVAARRHGRLSRRTYHSVGPNYMWHADGNDKMAPFGLPVHGAVCGYSRYVIWLKCCVSNHNPRQTAVYYLDAVEKFGAPYTLRVDHGTENRNFCIAHEFIWNGRERRNTLPLVIWGSSKHNQRVERYWGTLRYRHVGRWRNHFEVLVHEGILTCWDHVDRFVVSYCYREVIQCNLDKAVQVHNHMVIRSQRNADIPTGRPHMMYASPELYGGEDCKIEVDPVTVQALREELSGVSELNHAMCALADAIVHDGGLNPFPQNMNDCVAMYRFIRPRIKAHLENV